MATNTATSTPLDVDTAIAFCARWGKAWNDHDGDAVAELCAGDLVYDEPALGATTYGPDSIRSFVTAMAQAFPDYSFELVGLYPEVARRALLVAWHFTGTHARSGRPVEFHGDDRLELGDDGLIHAYRCVYDQEHIRRQLEHEPVFA